MFNKKQYKKNKTTNSPKNYKVTNTAHRTLWRDKGWQQTQAESFQNKGCLNLEVLRPRTENIQRKIRSFNSSCPEFSVISFRGGDKNCWVVYFWTRIVSADSYKGYLVLSNHSELSQLEARFLLFQCVDYNNPLNSLLLQSHSKFSAPQNKIKHLLSKPVYIMYVWWCMYILNCYWLDIIKNK